MWPMVAFRGLIGPASPPRPPSTPGQVAAGRWLVAGVGVFTMLGGIFMAWTTLSPRGQHFTRTHDRFFNRQAEQKLTPGQGCIVKVVTLASAALFIVGGLLVVVLAFVVDPGS